MNKKEITELFNNLPDRLIATIHKDPDFDAVGSILALNEVINILGKEITLLSPDINIKQFKHLPGIENLKTKTNSQTFDTAFFLDCSDKSRIAKPEQFPMVSNVINIDHHQDNTEFGDINIVENISSVGELIFNIIEILDIEITESIATNLFAAISFDTGSFKFSNATSETFLVAAKLRSLGINISKISEFIFEQKEKNYFEDIKHGLNNLYIDSTYPFMIVTIPYRKQLSKLSTINFFREYEDIELIVVIKEVKPKECKLSFRSKQFIDVTKIAKSFNGGGHKKAAGGYVKKDKHKVHSDLVEACKKVFK